ncbi:hypothetical protein ABH37_18700 [Mycobacterium haemophilum]|uniref:Uncharacterized protein n=1 Tax=Mycobacterium haemophilum TaxID=29311 RepID=A0A0I9YEF9_9MYCO|nr:hypothetical protein ABH39_19340 [Mycobacterium haemophilum]KLO34203.1 hypothetical protein ABH38_19590 [Mycobacterium haemophilum]KLO38312.1 hypothetical protein ABH37_18700 [Mycobacterium haemophilum]KLO43506.1 hypothetical protein ABH36_19815 [Mycobacterium haemophilum]
MGNRIPRISRTVSAGTALFTFDGIWSEDQRNSAAITPRMTTAFDTACTATALARKLLLLR